MVKEEKEIEELEVCNICGQQRTGRGTGIAYPLDLYAVRWWQMANRGWAGVTSQWESRRRTEELLSL